MNQSMHKWNLLLALTLLGACGGLDGTASEDDGAFGEEEVETMEQALSRASAEGEELAAAIPASGTLECGQSATIHSNGTGNEQRCEIEYENTCGASNLSLHGPLQFSPVINLKLEETTNNNTASASFIVRAGHRLKMNCCPNQDKDRYCRYEITGCETLEADEDAK